MDALARAIDLVGGQQILAKGCHVSYQAVQKWLKNGLPRTEWTGETAYSIAIENLTDGQITREQLLQGEPPKRRAGRPRLRPDIYGKPLSKSRIKRLAIQQSKPRRKKRARAPA